jgi:hypothetical protein
MNFKELFEGAEPKMPGAPGGIQIMTPQQFVAKAGDMPGEDDEQGVEEGYGRNSYAYRKDGGANDERHDLDPTDWYFVKDGKMFAISVYPRQEQEAISLGYSRTRAEAKAKAGQQGVAEGGYPEVDHMPGPTIKRTQTGCKRCHGKGYVYKTPDGETHPMNRPDAKKYKCGKCAGIGFVKVAEQGVAEGSQPNDIAVYHHTGPSADKKAQAHAMKLGSDYGHFRHDRADKNDNLHIVTQKRYFPAYAKQQGVAEGEEHLSRIRKLSGLEEATKLPASSREFGGDEFQDYMKRIVGTPDVDKAGNVKVDKKGNEKYVSGKTKTDRYKMPYIHRSSVIEYLGPDGTTYDEEAVKKTLAQRPKALLKQNEKMKHSNGEFEQFFNVGFAALTGIALDEQTNKLIIVNTCPGAGSCKVDCFAMKGGKVQFKNAWQSDGRILTYLLNDPDGFFNQLSNEISKEEQAGAKGDKKFPKGWKTTIRWHDAGDFFSPEYLDLALKMAAKHPDTKFYAYTKMAGAALAKKPANFIINWSEGAHTSQEKQVKASDANLDTTKNSRIVPDELFQDLLVKDEKKNLVKGSEGQWQVQPDKLPELKQRLAKQYGLSANSILDYNEYMAKRKSIPAGMKYNVIVAPGEGDISANDPNIISTLLLKH